MMDIYTIGADVLRTNAEPVEESTAPSATACSGEGVRPTSEGESPSMVTV